MTCTHYNFPVPEEKMVRVITDTDLCNEADDPFAVVQALLSPKFDNVGVVAAHFGTRDPNGMQKSWQGLKDLTVLMQLTVPVLHGAPHALPDAATPVPSEGAKLIIREAMKEDTRPLFVLLLGPLTDLASAYLQEPRIAGRLTAIWIGGAPYPVGGPEFNLGNDVNAVNVVFGSTMPVWQVPKNVYEMMPVSMAELEYRVRPREPWAATCLTSWWLTAKRRNPAPAPSARAKAGFWAITPPPACCCMNTASSLTGCPRPM